VREIDRAAQRGDLSSYRLAGATHDGTDWIETGD
jgi:hypothetical protein